MSIAAFATMPFSAFGDAVRPSGAVNRVTLPGTEVDAVSYSVYMNGPKVEELPENAREFHFKDVMVAAMTAKMGLDDGNFRDNMKIAEIVAVRSTWMTAVREAAKDRSTKLSPQVMEDYQLLADTDRAMNHPWIQAQIERQVMASRGLPPVLAEASKALGGVAVKDRAPREVGMGRVVAGNKDFTVQRTTDGEVVTHDNRYLKSVPAVGEDVTVSYYRGHGQVVDSLEKVKVSEPFIEEKHRDVAVTVQDGKGQSQMVLFNSITAFAAFVEAHGLDKAYVEQAMDALAALPKLAPPEPMVIQGDPYIEEESGCLAVDFVQGGVRHTALFGDAGALVQRAGEYGLSPKQVESIRNVQAGPVVDADHEKKSLTDLFSSFDSHKLQVQAPQVGDTYVGKVIAESNLHVAQKVGRDAVVVYDLRELDRVARIGESMTVKWQGDRGQVVEVERDQVQGVER